MYIVPCFYLGGYGTSDGDKIEIKSPECHWPCMVWEKSNSVKLKKPGTWLRGGRKPSPFSGHSGIHDREDPKEAAEMHMHGRWSESSAFVERCRRRKMDVAMVRDLIWLEGLITERVGMCAGRSQSRRISRSGVLSD